ncbi:hypothetical protein FRX31_030084 [Thalictrum thalictroides]|uniref:Uncharacterized protein n=1 Tax=Thalictrum thalictroides TaxID=46969 RepID=A0A7J6V5H7_THATH|nr:hypothetical protein FRX31_030084 [Thalictrum thalictroides]
MHYQDQTSSNVYRASLLLFKVVLCFKVQTLNAHRTNINCITETNLLEERHLAINIVNKGNHD